MSGKVDKFGAPRDLRHGHRRGLVADGGFGLGPNESCRKQAERQSNEHPLMLHPPFRKLETMPAVETCMQNAGIRPVAKALAKRRTANELVSAGNSRTIVRGSPGQWRQPVQFFTHARRAARGLENGPGMKPEYPHQPDPHNPSTVRESLAQAFNEAMEAMKKQESLHTTATTYPIE